MGFIYVLIALAAIGLIFVIFTKGPKARKHMKQARDELELAQKKQRDLVRKLGWEQRDAAKIVELRNKTLEMYIQSRIQAESEDRSPMPGIKSDE